MLTDKQDVTEANTLSAIEKTTVGIYVVKETHSSDYSDVGIILEGVVVLQDIENVALATAMLFGLFYTLNMRYPAKLRYTSLQVIQKDSNIRVKLTVRFDIRSVFSRRLSKCRPGGLR
ncbi:hypothetical protein F2P81_007558 [Scophthalmus maximus]|uniref:Uncharacterized protein n=1 Tax=Scophthalmus maximus TaxID=52904 RepID=A0A6A4SZQ8_SCOMX|nr:hypothetical protein F2P81_007558 [Scophthalmus maximus]